MKRKNIPASVLDKLIELGDAAEHLSERAKRAEEALVAARQRLTGSFRDEEEYDNLRATLAQLTTDLPALKSKSHAASSVYSSCRDFIDALPPSTALEPVTIDVSGRDLDEVRGKLEAAQAELKRLRAAPTPSADIEERIRAYVQSMARPAISGIGKGEKLKLVWPGAGFGPSGPREDRADPLALMAFLHGDAMVAALMREVERMASDPLPIKERAARIAALTDEIEQLSYVEEVLVAVAIADGEDVQRSPSAPPRAVLQVRIAEALKSSRAA